MPMPKYVVEHAEGLARLAAPDFVGPLPQVPASLTVGRRS